MAFLVTFVIGTVSLAALPWSGDPGYEIEIVAGGFQLPVNIAFVPDPESDLDAPFFYVTELRGTIKVVTRAGAVSDYATGLLNYNPPTDFPGPGEQGLTGIVVDPASGDVFASMLYESSPGTNFPKVVRLTSTDGGRTAASQITLLDMVGESQGQSHQISNVTIGPDGKLYVHVGDGFNWPSAQDLGSYRGKILRMNLDGSAPPDNPFYDAGDGIDSEDYTWALGLRNPFGGDWRGADGRHYKVANGPNVDRFAQVLAGRNFGWNGTSASMTIHALYNWSPATAPVNIAFVQPESQGGSGFPIDKLGRAFVSQSGKTYWSGVPAEGKDIVEFELDAAGNVIGGPTTIMAYTGTGKATVVGLAAGPDGLYFSDLYKDQGASSPVDPGANILRLRSLDAPRLELAVAAGLLSWETLPGVGTYDILRGSLALLRSTGGDFTSATTDCLYDDRASDTLPETDSVPAGGFWYLVRDLTSYGTGSYESGGTRQLGLRDAEIAAAGPSCP